MDAQTPVRASIVSHCCHQSHITLAPPPSLPAQGLNQDLPMTPAAKDLILQEWVDLRQTAKNA
jgi:hypothetical protein